MSTTLWKPTCPDCSGTNDEPVYLQYSDGGMVCPACARIDPHATSVVNHVDVSDLTGNIVDSNDALETLEHSRARDVDWQERRFNHHVDGLIRANLQRVFKRCNYTLENGSKLWFERIRKYDQDLKGLDRPMFSLDARRLPYYVLLAVRLAVQESNLIMVYNRLPGLKIESSGAVQHFCKGDDGAFALTTLELFRRSQKEFGPGNPCRVETYDSLCKTDKRLSSDLDTTLTPGDETRCAISRALSCIRRHTQASVDRRKGMLEVSQVKVDWPEEPFSCLQRITDWDDVFRIAHGLYQAQLCISLFPDTVRSVAGPAIALACAACQIVAGVALKNMTQLEVELSAHFDIKRTSVQIRAGELIKLVLAWSTSIPEAALPLPTLDRPKRSSMIGGGDAGWGSDKRRSVPVMAIVPKAGRTIAEHWRAIKRVRLRRPAVIPFDEEAALAKKLFTGQRVERDLYALFRKYTVVEPAPSRSVSPSKSDSSSASVRSAVSRSDTHSTQAPSLAGPSTPTIRPPSPVRPRNKIDEVREWIEKGDDSSDDDDGRSTDDETPRAKTKRPRVFGTNQVIGELPRPFAFSIGPTGFGIDRTDASPASSVDPVKRDGSIPLSSRAQSVESSPSEGLTTASDSCQMVRQPSVGSSTGSTFSSSSMRSAPLHQSARATPLRSINSPAPSSSSFVSERSRSVEIQAIRRGLLNDNDHVGVLIRERPQYAASEFRPAKVELPIETGPALPVYIAATIWQEQRKASGVIPSDITPETLKVLGLPDGRLPRDLRTYLASQPSSRSHLEHLLRLGILPKSIPHHLLPRSVCAVNLDLYHFADRDAILGKGSVNETAELYDMSMRLFFRAAGNDTLPETFLTEEQQEERIKDYYKRGDWDVLDDPSPVKKATKRKRKQPDPSSLMPENMLQRIAYEYDHGIEKQGSEAETEMIQKAVMAGLLHVQPRPPLVETVKTANVPSLWFNDRLFELHLVPYYSSSVSKANELTDKIWSDWNAQSALERNEQALHCSN